MITVSETVEVRAASEVVFAYVADSGTSLAHDRPSRLKLEILSDQPTGLGATYRYSGTVKGLSIDFSESVTKYLPPHEKVWRTIAEPRSLIIASYEMRVAIEIPVAILGAADGLDRLRLAPFGVLADRGPVTSSTV